MKNNIKNLLAIADITAKDFAFEIGVTPVQVSNYVTGKQLPSVKTALKMGVVFSVPVEKIFEL